jgi:hypothetical protein
MSGTQKLKFGLIGCGRVSENHAAALSGGQIPAGLSAVCDLDAARAEATGGKYKVPWYTDYHEMMKAEPQLDAVSIATPTGYHAAHVIDLARYGKSLVVEKTDGAARGRLRRDDRRLPGKQLPAVCGEAESIQSRRGSGPPGAGQQSLRQDCHGNGARPLETRPEVLRAGSLARHLGTGRGSNESAGQSSLGSSAVVFSAPSRACSARRQRACSTSKWRIRPWR